MSKNYITNIYTTLIFYMFFSISSFAHQPINDNNNFINYQDLFHLEYAAKPTMMPDGRRVLYERHSMDIMTDNLRRSLWVVAIDGSEHRPLLSTTDDNNHHTAVFSPNGNKLAYLSAAKGQNQIMLLDLTTGSSTALIPNIENNAIISPHLSFSPDSSKLAFSMFTKIQTKPIFNMDFKPKAAQWEAEAQYIDKTLFQRDGQGIKHPGYMHIYTVPLIGGKPRQISYGERDYSGRLTWSQDGQTILVSANTRADADFDVLNTDLLAIDIQTSQIKSLTKTSGPESDPTFSPDGKWLAFIGFEDNHHSHQNQELYLKAVNGTDIIRLTPDLDRKVADIHWRNDSQGLYFSYDDHGKKWVAYVDLNGNIHKKTDKLGGLSIGRPYTSGHYTFVNHKKTPNLDQLVFTHSFGNRPADLALLNDKGQLIQLTDLNGDLFDHKILSQPQLLSLTSSVDQRQLQAWVVTPPNFDPNKKYPLILEIHGGPHTAYGPEFSTEIQMFAAAGYVVVYGNPRGSTSQGSDFANLINKNYPSQDYNDLIDMVDATIAKGYIDKQQLFVTGGSGGGVLTAWIIGKTKRFKAAVVAKPVINWTSMIGTSDIYTFMTRYWFNDLPWNNYREYWDRSPLSLVGNVTTPTMVLTGELDVRTPMGESEQYYGALRLQGVESALVRIQGAYHGIAARPSNLARKIGYILAWFDQYRTDEKK